MLPVRSVAQARCMRARNQRFTIGMVMLFALLATYSLWPYKATNRTGKEVTFGINR